MTTEDMRAWHDAMGYTYDTGAAALGVSRGTYADWLSGRSRTTGKPIMIKRTAALACAALAAGLGEWRSPSGATSTPR
jgi:transcriptional regulator with XRE-family HTH domain